MSGSFFDNFPKKRITRVFLLVGVGGCLGLSALLLLLKLRTAEQQDATFAIESSSLPPQNSAERMASSVVPLITDSQVSINAASQEELEELPHIGTKKATQIMNQRPYQSIDELFVKNKFNQKQEQELRKLIRP